MLSGNTQANCGALWYSTSQFATEHVVSEFASLQFDLAQNFPTTKTPAKSQFVLIWYRTLECSGDAMLSCNEEDQQRHRVDDRRLPEFEDRSSS